MASKTENDDFGEALFSDWPLDAAIGWIQANMKPEDVFTTAQLKNWVREHEYAKKE